MEPLPLLVNGVISLVTAAGLTAVILSRRIQEGFLIKLGLVIVVFSLGASAWLSLFGDAPMRGLVNSAFALRVGLIITCIGVGWRVLHSEGRK